MEIIYGEPLHLIQIYPMGVRVWNVHLNHMRITQV